MDIITKDTIKEVFYKLKKLNNANFKFIYTAKQNTFGYANIEEIYYKGNSILIGNKTEILKFQEYRMNLEIDLINKENPKDSIIKNEDIEYIDELKERIKKIKNIDNSELIGISDEGELLYNLDLYKVLQEIYLDITEERIIEN